MFTAKSRDSPKIKAEAAAGSPKSRLEPAAPVQANPLWHRLATRVQPKLTVGASNDPHEHEADRVADQVMRMPAPAASAAPPNAPVTSTATHSPQLRRACAECEEEEEDKEEKEGKTLQAKPMRAPGNTLAGGGKAPPIVHDVLSFPGQPLDPATRAFMETRFGHDFGQVRVHADARAAESARAVNALAYTVGRDVVFSEGHYTPHLGQGSKLLAHELAHVIQQERGGSAPEMSAGAAHEREAEVAAKAAVSDAGHVTVSGATGVGIARTPLDWAETNETPDLSAWAKQTPDLGDWSDIKLEDKLDEIVQWRGSQISTTPKSMLADLAVVQLRSEIDRKAKAKTAKLKPSKRGGATRPEGKKEPEVSATQEPAPPLPRILRERTSVQYAEGGIREEIDRIRAWLQRRDLAPGDRQILELELAKLAPRREEDRDIKFAKRRAEKIGQMLTGTPGTDVRENLLDQFRRIDSIVPLKDQPGRNALSHGGEMIILTDAEVAALRASARTMLDLAAEKARGMNEDTYTDIEDHLEHWSKQHNFVRNWVSRRSGETPEELEDRVREPLTKSNGLITSHKQRDPWAGDVPLAKQAKVVLDAVELAKRARQTYVKGDADAMEAAGDIARDWDLARSVAFLFALVASAGAAAPALGALGTVGVVGVEGVILGAGTTMAGEALAGRSWEDVKAAGWKEGKRGGETGLKIGGAVAFAAALGTFFGASTQGISRASQVARSGGLAGTTSVVIETAAEAAHGRVIDPRAAAAQFVGGFAGGSGGRLANIIKNPVGRGAAQLAVGSGSGGLAGYVATGDVNKSLESAAIGGGTVLALGRAQTSKVAPPETTARPQPKAVKPAAPTEPPVGQQIPPKVVAPPEPRSTPPSTPTATVTAQPGPIPKPTTRHEMEEAAAQISQSGGTSAAAFKPARRVGPFGKLYAAARMTVADVAPGAEIGAGGVKGSNRPAMVESPSRVPMDVPDPLRAVPAVNAPTPAASAATRPSVEPASTAPARTAMPAPAATFTTAGSRPPTAAAAGTAVEATIQRLNAIIGVLPANYHEREIFEDILIKLSSARDRLRAGELTQEAADAIAVQLARVEGAKEAVQVSGDVVQRAGKAKIAKGLDDARAASKPKPAAAVEAKTAQKKLGAEAEARSAEKELAGEGFIEGPAKAIRPGPAPKTGFGKAARHEFEKVRDGYAKRLGVPSYGQVHHGIELQALDRYPGVYTARELNTFENMRGISTEVAGRRQLHNSKVREVWDRHYARMDKEIKERGLKPGTPQYNEYVKKNLQDGRDEMDYVLGQFFTEYRTGKPRSFK